MMHLYQKSVRIIKRVSGNDACVRHFAIIQTMSWNCIFAEQYILQPILYWIPCWVKDARHGSIAQPWHITNALWCHCVAFQSRLSSQFLWRTSQNESHTSVQNIIVIQWRCEWNVVPLLDTKDIRVLRERRQNMAHIGSLTRIRNLALNLPTASTLSGCAGRPQCYCSSIQMHQMKHTKPCTWIFKLEPGS